MKIHEKIKVLLKEKGWKVKTLHREIVDLFEDNAIVYLTLGRIIRGQTKLHDRLRESTLFQIATALGTTPLEIRKDTEEEEKFILLEYNKKAWLKIDNNNLEFLTGRLFLLPGARTEKEQDPIERGNFVKYIYGLHGEVTCVVTRDNREEKHHIKKNESFFFSSTHPHYFENNAGQKATCLLIQNPKYY